MIRQPISAAIVVALSFAPAFADEPVASASLLAVAAPEEALVSGPDGHPGLLSPDEIGPDTSMAAYFDPNVSSELRHAALRAAWRANPKINRTGMIFDATQ